MSELRAEGLRVLTFNSFADSRGRLLSGRVSGSKPFNSFADSSLSRYRIYVFPHQSFNSFADSRPAAQTPDINPLFPFNSFADSRAHTCHHLANPRNTLSIPLRIRDITCIGVAGVGVEGSFNSFADSRGSSYCSRYRQAIRGPFNSFADSRNTPVFRRPPRALPLSIPLRIREALDNGDIKVGHAYFQFLCGFEKMGRRCE